MLTFLILISNEALAGDYILNWRDNSKPPNDALGFYVMQRYGPASAPWEVLDVTPKGTTTLPITIPNDKTRWCFNVVAFNEVGESKPSNNVCLRD